MRVLLVGTLVVAGVVVPLQADTPDPLEIVRQAQAAIRSLKAIRYEGQGEVEGVMRLRIPRMEGVVTLAPLPNADVPRLRVEGRSTEWNKPEPAAVQLLCDGKKVSFVHYGEKAFASRELPGGVTLLNNGTPLLMRELANPRPLEREATAREVRHVGTETVGDVECDAIHFVYAADGGEVRWYFAKSDHLPRRVERYVDSPVGKSTIRISINRLELNPEIKDELFAFQQPEGFKDMGAAREPASGGDNDLLAVGSVAPDWTLKDGDGREVSLKSLRGKVVLLDFWATWCAPCRIAMPHIQRLYDKYKDKPVAIYGVNCWERDPKAKPLDFMKSLKHTYPQLLDGNAVAAAYQVKGIPTFYLISPEGKILMTFAGMTPDLEKTVDDLIAKTLQGTPAPTTAPAAAK